MRMPATAAGQSAPVCGHAMTSTPAEVGEKHTAATIGTARVPPCGLKTTEVKWFNGSGGSAVMLSKDIVALTLTPLRLANRKDALRPEQRYDHDHQLASG